MDLAIPACESAVRQYPNSIRLIFSLGRAYEMKKVSAPHLSNTERRRRGPFGSARDLCVPKTPGRGDGDGDGEARRGWGVNE